MSTFVRRLNILAWPLWVKLAVGFATAIVIPTLLILGIGWGGIGEVGLQNVQTYILETGTRQRQAITDLFNQELFHQKSFSLNPNYRSAVITALEGGNTTVETVRRVLRQGLLDATSPDDTVWLLDASGLVVASASRLQEVDAGFLGIQPGQDESTSPVFQAGRNLAELNKDQDIAVYTRGDRLVIAVVTALKSGNETIGYLVSSIDPERAVYANLKLQDDTLPAYSYLVERTGGSSPPELAEQIGDITESLAVGRALGGERGVDVYETRIGPVVGYYAPLIVQGQTVIQFALVTEIDRSIVSQQVIDYLSSLAFPLITGTVALLVVLSLLFTQLFVPPLNQLLSAIRAMAGGNYDAPLPAAQRGDEFGKVAASFVDMRHRVQDLVSDLIAQMEQRARDIETTQEISRFAASQRDLQTLMDSVVVLIVERFEDVYHAQIFLVDTDRVYAVLRASTGEAGQKLMQGGHRLPIGSLSVIGQVTQEERAVIVRDTTTSEVHRRNEFLPDTRAELAIPLRVGETVIGALDVQSQHRGSFSDDEVTVLQTLASQVAVAIQNALLYQESLRRLEELEASHRQAALRAWAEYMAAERLTALSSTAGTETGVDTSDLRQAAIIRGRSVGQGYQTQDNSHRHPHSVARADTRRGRMGITCRGL
jgi:putative methionine-R-sulfoxide reductase with GAF domain